MALIDFILNLAGLLLWLNWRAAPHDPLTNATAATLAGTLRRTGTAPVKRWYFLAALGGLLLARAWLCWQLGPALNWTARLNLVATHVAFKSDFFPLMLLYAALSFARLLAIFWLWLLLLALLTEKDDGGLLPVRLAREQLGFVSGFPEWTKLLLPLVAGLILWWVLSWPLGAWGLMPRPGSELARVAQAGLVGLSAYLAWKYLIAGIFTLRLLHNYIYFGRHPIWEFVDAAARRLLKPLRVLPLRAGKVDFAPAFGIVLVLLLAHFAEAGLPPAQMDVNGRRERRAFELPGLVELYERTAR